MRYEFTLKNEKVKTYEMIRGLLILLNALALLYVYIVTPETFKKPLYPVFGITVSGIYFVLIFIEWLSKKPAPDKWSYRHAFWLGTLVWLRSDYWVFGILGIFFVGLDFIVTRKFTVLISDKIIQLPFVPVKKIQWNELSNVILNGGILTIDFKNNTLFQHEILGPDQDVFEEKFNQFCQTQLNSASQLSMNV